MKKFFKFTLLIVFLLFGAAVFCQNQVYHRIGDTIDGKDTIYWRAQWFESFINKDSTPDATWSSKLTFILGERVEYFYTQSPLQVIGIAASAGFSDSHDPGSDTFARPEYFVLYNRRNGQNTLLGSLRWRHTDPHRYIISHAYFSNVPGQGCTGKEWSRVFPIYEYYFDQPVTVRDTFAIGATDHSRFVYISQNENNPPQGGEPDYYAYGPYNPSCTPSFPYQLFSTIADRDAAPYPAGMPYFEYRQEMFHIYPILLLDTSYAYPDTVPYSCPIVRNLHANNTWESGGFVLWNVEARHREWELRVAPVGGDPESAFFDTLVNVPFAEIHRLNAFTHYSVFVRARCEHHGETYWSDWSDPMDLFTKLDINQIEESNNSVTLHPNPSNGKVTIESPQTMTSAQLYNTQGQQLRSIPLNSNQSALDLSDLPSGVYFLIVQIGYEYSTNKLIIK